MNPDWARLRAQFPILATKTYLASHSMGAMPRATAHALQEYHEEWASMGIEAWDGPWWKAVQDFGADMESLLHAPRGTVTPLPNATRAMAAVASCLRYDGKRRRILLTDLEFTTFYPFWKRQEQLGAQVDIVAQSELADAIDDRTLLVATCHGFFRSGALQDLRPLVKACKTHGARLLVDGYQVVGCVPVDVQALGVDFYLGGSHKWLCGGPGAGYLYTRKDLLPDLDPRLTGWFGLANPFAYELDLGPGDLHQGPLRFLDGTPNIPGLYAAREGIRVVKTTGVDAIRARSRTLTQRIVDGAQALGARLVSPPRFEDRNGMVCLDVPKAEHATQQLVRGGVVVDYRPDCGLRASPHFYNDTADVDRFLEGLAKSLKGKTVKSSAR